MQVHFLWLAWCFFFAVELGDERHVANEDVVRFQVIVDEAEVMDAFEDGYQLQANLQYGLNCELVAKEVDNFSETVAELIHDEAVVELADLLVHLALALVLHFLVFTIVILFFF